MFSLGAFGNVFYLILLLITRKNNLHLLYSFAAIFFIGLWNCTTSGIIQLITGDYELISFFEYFSIYTAFVMYLFLIGVIKKQSSNAKIVDSTKLVSLLFLIIATLIHVLGILCISKTIMFFRNYALVVMLILFYVIYKDVKSQKQYGRIFAVGSSLSFVLIILHIIIHNFQLMQLREITNDNFITLAILVMVILPLLLYILKLDAIGDYEAQIKVLKSLAYVDKLTGLGNRTSGIAYVMDLIKNELDYYIVMFDLNNLKKVNDSFGHSRGDELIVDFANCLKNAFDESYSKKIRYGGDEFIVIAKQEEIGNINDNIENLFKFIDENNCDVCKKYSLSFSYGVASSKEVNISEYEKVMKLADERMYEYKKKVKQGSIVRKCHIF